MESSLRKLIWDFLFFSGHLRICLVMSDLLNKAHTSCVIWSKMEFYWRRRCAITCPTPGTFLTTGLVKNFSRYIAKDSFPSNSYQFYISRYNFIKVLWFLCIRLRKFAGFNSAWYQITHPSAPPIPSNPLPLLTPATQFRQIRTFPGQQ